MDKHEEDVYLAWLSCFEVESNDPLSPFLWGSQDSFNNGAPSSLLCQEELMPRLRGDFIDVVTTISRAYQRDDYLEMKPLDDIAWKAFGSGSIFNVGRSNLQFETVTPMSNQPRKVFNIIVIKRINNWSMTSDKIRSFNRELMILDHLRNEESIVTLRGIGWFYHSENLPSVPEPVIMLEEAFNTLQYVIGKHLPSTTMLRIFHDVAKGLSVLHAHGIVHGDIKIDNVLLFQKKSVEAGVEDDIFVAKLSDFNLAMLDNGGRQYRLGGTSMYMSPESGDYLNFDQLKLTDVYALGVLYALVASDTDNMLSLDVRQLITENTTLDLMEQIILQLNIDMESSTRTPQQIALLFGIFLNSLASNPIDRSLDRVMHCFESYFGDFQSPRPNDTARLIDPSPTDLIISYGKFMSLSGNIKDEITKALIEIASSDENDSRRAKAFFELAVIHCSQYASPWHTATRGLQYLWDAAEHGDLRARALYRRLHQAYRCNVNPEFHSRQVEWLTSAAESGYKIALDELVATGNTTQKKRALERYAISRLQENFKPRLSQDSSWSNQESFVPWPGSPFESLEYMIHLAAATGSSETVVSLIERHHRLLNYRNDSGDTPLLSACRYGQFDVSLTLLRNSADASLTNASGENGLHFLWRFCTSEAQILIVELLQHGANPDQYASLSQSGGDWDLIPNIVSNPIERLVSYNRLDLVKLLIEVGCGIFPRNGNQLRRMLLLAIRLQHVDMQFFLIEYASKQDKDYRQDLAPLDEVQWEYKSRTRSYLDAAVLGWTRQTGQGIDVPLNFWQACCHGADWLTAMKSTVDISLNLTGSSGINQTALDAAIRIAIGEKSYPVFEYLFITKVVLTDGNRNRVKSLYKFCWKEETNGDSEQKSYSLLNLPPKKINYIDQVFHYRKATLAQQAVWKGDRSLFHLCVHRLGADLLLPFKTRHHKKLGQFNCYVGIALSEHQDIWFA
ncbi:hypothetical protein F4679DRAFT_516712 [Xylaria curta]|nr:hypothetical protein F4679DRAFT_516712 [Xylaria curta]